MDLPDKFTMHFKPMTIEHLGLKLYSKLPPVMCELVSNAWDADAKKVEITLPNGIISETSEVVVRDYDSIGMDAHSLQNEYLPIGRNCREDLRSDKSKNGRPLMGRKGLGKLAAFGVASELEIFTVKRRKAICLKLDYNKMKSWPSDSPYEPEIINSRCGSTREPQGTELRIRKLYRRSQIDENVIRKGIARRFTVIRNDFEVLVNGKPITHEDRRLKKDCKKSWDAQDLPGKAIVDGTEGWVVTGWIGIVEKSSQVERGVDIFARGKAVELETMFGLKTTHIQFARAYVVGEIHADFLDAEYDNVSTGRNSVQWETVPGQKLEAWGQQALKHVFDEWLKLQRKEKEEKIVRTADFDRWLLTRSDRERKVANKLISVIVEDPDIDPESAEQILDMIKANVEYQAFQELVDEMEESGPQVPKFLRLFEDWRVIEAREHLKLSDGRLEVMEKLSKFVKEGALEVKEIQPLFEENGWLVNPTWTRVTGQNRYTELLRKHSKEPNKLEKKDRRIDILGYSAGDSLCVVELKRPKKTLSRGDLEQVERYVDWARTNLVGTGQGSPKYVAGLLIVGKRSGNKTIHEKEKRLAGSDIRIETYDDLLERARNIYGEVEKQLKKIAPEYSREARRKRKKANSKMDKCT